MFRVGPARFWAALSPQYRQVLIPRADRFPVLSRHDLRNLPEMVQVMEGTRLELLVQMLVGHRLMQLTGLQEKSF
jgi:hypothetical protein